MVFERVILRDFFGVSFVLVWSSPIILVFGAKYSGSSGLNSSSIGNGGIGGSGGGLSEFEGFEGRF